MMYRQAMTLGIVSGASVVFEQLSAVAAACSQLTGRSITNVAQALLEAAQEMEADPSWAEEGPAELARIELEIRAQLSEQELDFEVEDIIGKEDS